MPLSPARTYVYATFHCVNLLCISFCTTCNLAFANKMDWKSLGVILDQRLTFNEHATAVVKSCNYHARAIRHVRHLLTESVAQTLACSLLNSRLDYCNSLLYGAPEATVDKLQRAQNNAARAVLSANGRADARPLLRQLHWLAERQRIFYKTAVLALRVNTTGVPAYLKQHLHHRYCLSRD